MIIGPLRRKYSILQKVTVLISLALFIGSLTQPAFITEGQKYSSLLSILVGAISILGGAGLEWLTWLANPIYFISIVLFLKGDHRSISTSVLSALIAVSFLSWEKILVSESGRTAFIDSFESGYFLWLASLSVLSVGVMIYFRLARLRSI
jgi:hypothetical protein